MKLSRNLSLQECTKSPTAIRLGILNHPSVEEIANLKLIAKNVFQPLRDYYGLPIAISSGYRSEELNEAVGGSKTSHHITGQALDIDADVMSNGLTNKQIFDYIKNRCEFCQLIWEFGSDNQPAWVHVSYVEDDNRGEVLRAVRTSKGVVYATYSPVL